MKIVLAIVMACLLSACEYVEDKSNESILDQCKRAELFDSCLKNIPKGPTVIGNSNDWDEVVDSCARSAQYMSYRLRKTIPMECQGQ